MRKMEKVLKYVETWEDWQKLDSIDRLGLFDSKQSFGTWVGKRINIPCPDTLKNGP